MKGFFKKLIREKETCLERQPRNEKRVQSAGETEKRKEKDKRMRKIWCM